MFQAKSELQQLDKTWLGFRANVTVALRKVITSEKNLLQNFLETSHLNIHGGAFLKYTRRPS